MPLAYEDKHNYNTNQGYIVTNEEPDVHSTLLKGIRVDRAAAIASGGEVALFSLLPRVRKELVLVDHFYGAIAVSMAKAVLLEELGPPKLREVFTNSSKEEVKKLFELAAGKLPSELATHCTTAINQRYEFFDSIRREWHYAREVTLARAKRKLSKLSFIHGDIGDIIDRGPFDLVYISNIFGHVGRGGQQPTHEKIESLLSTGGYVLLTGTIPFNFPEGRWEIVAKVRGFRTSWDHVLYKRTPTSSNGVRAEHESQGRGNKPTNPI
jgi:hypothetical protein